MKKNISTKTIFLERTFPRGDDSSLPVCSVSFTVHLQLFTNNDIL